MYKYFHQQVRCYDHSAFTGVIGVCQIPVSIRQLHNSTGQSQNELAVWSIRMHQNPKNKKSGYRNVLIRFTKLRAFLFQIVILQSMYSQYVKKN